MHPANQYAEHQPDFAELAEQYPRLRPYLSRRGKGSAAIDFTNPSAVR